MKCLIALIILGCLITLPLFSEELNEYYTILVPNNQIDTLSNSSEHNNKMIKEFSKGKLVKNDLSRTVIRDIMIYPNFIRFVDNRDNKIKKVSISDITILSVVDGSYWLEGLLTGTGAGLLIYFGYIPPEKKDFESFIISTSICSSIGFLIGACLDNSRVIIQTGNLFISKNMDIPINNNFYSFSFGISLYIN